MKKLVITSMFSLIMLLMIAGSFSLPTQAKSNDYWISGYGGGMGLKEKKIKATYKGNKIRISGYGCQYDDNTDYAKTKKLKSKTFKVSSKCKVGTGGYERSYKKFLKKKGRQGRLNLFVDIHIKNNKVVYVDYSY